jgi:hypothetical protein
MAGRLVALLLLGGLTLGRSDGLLRQSLRDREDAECKD